MAQRAPACRSTLPKIPGIYRSFTEIKDKYPIGYDLEVIDNVMFIKSIEKERDDQLCTDPDVAMAMRAKGCDIVKKRPWMVMDKEMLCFDAYYKYTLLGGYGKTKYAVRKLKINYFLVDKTIQVNEPTEPNSGTTQGCFIKRQKIPLPGCDQGTGPYYKLFDLNIGNAVTFFGKELVITGVNNYTRDFLNKMGVDVLDNQPIPDDPYYAHRKETELDVVPKIKSKSIRNLPPNGFDGLILRFRGYWDDRYELEGELHFYEVLYYLVDGTMELVEELTDDNRPEVTIRKTFVKRQKLPMNGPWCVSPGFNAKQEILNVLPDGLNSYYYKMDSRVLDNREVKYYQCTDLFIGATLNVYSRRIVLVKCDRLTEDFYRTVYGLENFEPIEAPKTRREIEEDQLNKKRVEIILKNHDEVLRKRLIKRGATGMVFAFIIKMVTNDPINKKRDFMLKYYLDDTDFAIYEYRETNSVSQLTNTSYTASVAWKMFAPADTCFRKGIRGGMFRSKRGFDKAQSEHKRFAFHQLAVGVEITIDDFEFIITDVDDKTLRFMIDNPDEFPHSDLATLKIKTLETINNRFASLDEFRTKCFQSRELVDRNEFRDILSFGGALGPHVGVVFTLMHKRPDPFEPFTDHVLRSVIQDALRKAQFIHFDGLKSNFKSRKSISDRHGTSYTRREESIKAMKSNKVPLSWEIINILFDKFTDAEHDGVDYVAMVDFMDYVADPVELPVGLARELLFVKPKKVLVRVNEFVDALRPTTTTTTTAA